MRLNKLYSIVLVASSMSGVAFAEELDGSIKGVAELGKEAGLGFQQNSERSWERDPP